MSKEIIKDEQRNLEYCNTTIKMEEGARTLYLLLGERLMNIRNERLYEPAWGSWQEYTMEFKDMSPASISKLISVYEVFVVKFGYTPDQLAKSGGWTKLYQMLKFIHSKDDADKWLLLAENTSRQDLGKHIVEAGTGVDMTQCKHPHTFLVRVCEDCGDKWKEYQE